MSSNRSENNQESEMVDAVYVRGRCWRKNPGSLVQHHEHVPDGRVSYVGRADEPVSKIQKEMFSEFPSDKYHCEIVQVIQVRERKSKL